MRSLRPLHRGAATALLLAAGAAWAQDQLPPGPGRDVVAQKCYACHAFEARVGNGYDAAGWETVLRMMTNHGVELTPAEIAQLTPYLVQNFPEKNKVPAVIVPGPLQVAMQVFTNGITPGSRPHDPLATRDGALWYTGQMSNMLGRVDRKTGEVKEYPLKMAHSGPHSLTLDRRGDIWYTANSGAMVGRLDPRTGGVTEYRMPDGTGDPHTLLNAGGMILFTLQKTNQVGRLDPRTGAMKFVTLPTPDARPGGMTLDPRGLLFIAESGTNRVAMVNPDTMAVREYKLPDADSRPRRIAATPDNKIWYTDHARGRLGRLDPGSGDVKEWPSPSGPRSAPYGIAAIGDVLWYCESGTTPNTLVRFDSETGKFQSWPIPGGGNIVRNISVTTENDLVLAHSLMNAVTLVKTPR